MSGKPSVASYTLSEVLMFPSIKVEIIDKSPKTVLKPSSISGAVDVSFELKIASIVGSSSV